MAVEYPFDDCPLDLEEGQANARLPRLGLLQDEVVHGLAQGGVGAVVGICGDILQGAMQGEQAHSLRRISILLAAHPGNDTSLRDALGSP